MSATRSFSWRARARSFKYAFRGIRILIGSEHNAWIHLCVAAIVVFAGALMRISPTEWGLVSLCIGGVLMAEAFNTAIEALADKVSPQKDPLIAKAKDVAAGAVLIFVFAAVAVGLIVFIPKICALCNL